MVDPALATLVLSSVNTAANAASQEAGKQAWQGLVALVRRARRQPDAEVEPAHTEALAATLVTTAGHDTQFAADLRRWIEHVAQLAPRSEDTSNSIAGDARVAGNVVQARDVQGSVTFR
jgi:Tfp pilus assembly protein PilV